VINRNRKIVSSFLFLSVIANYIAQIFYYLHLYYFPYNDKPPFLGSLLLGATLLWFLIGFVRYKHNQMESGLLRSFVIVQVIFYGYTIILALFGGGIAAQYRSRDIIVLAVDTIGYVNFLAAIFWLIFATSKPLSQLD